MPVHEFDVGPFKGVYTILPNPVAPEEWVKYIVETGKTLFEEDGYAAPFAQVLAGPLMATIIIGPFLKDGGSKTVLDHNLREICKRLNATAVVLVCEAWTATDLTPEEEDRADREGLEGFAGRGEILQFITQLKGRPTVYETYEIDRTGESPVLGTGRQAQGGFGRFHDLLDQQPPAQA